MCCTLQKNGDYCLKINKLAAHKILKCIIQTFMFPDLSS